MTGAPSTRSLVTLCVLLTLGVASVLALYAMTAPGQRFELLTVLAPVGAAVIAGVPGLLAWLSGRNLGERLDAVEENTNGYLTTRLAGIADDIVTRISSRVTDSAPAPIPKQTDPAGASEFAAPETD